MDEIDKKILNILQKEFPLEERPYLIVAQRLGIGEDDVLSRVQRLKDEGVIRRIGAVFDGAKLGRVSTLCAARVPEEKVGSFVEAVNAFRGVTHNYRRGHEYNVWFTASAENEEALSEFLQSVKDKTGLTDILDMRAARVFKINASFDL
ncbi:MAG: Lrp/AsnC family transcriptional regulator [Smithella sp.]|jgi:DNA-binding Lrp family transcriptional regulator|nr:Lrp/AsnC family transcriptional regulator [Smithella sp.]